jgi:predicted component of type VI protein secretion system
MPADRSGQNGLPPASLGCDFEVVLKPLSRPELSDIRMDSELTIGRTEPPFAGYAHDVVRQLSRQHARIYCREGGVYLTDLGSRNGTTVNRAQVRQTPYKLGDGDEICLGGQLSYRVNINPSPRWDGSAIPSDSSSNGSLVAAQPASALPPGDDKTRFVDSPTSFLKLFSNAAEPKHEVPSGSAVVLAADAKEPPLPQRGRVVSLLREFASLDANGGHDVWRRNGWKAAAIVAVFSALALTAYFWNAAERNLKQAIAHGDYAQAAALADRLLQKHPDDIQLKAQATDATLKANVPVWLAKMRSRDFDGANAVLAGMSGLSAQDVELQSLKGELEWVGDLERLVSNRGGPEAPVRIYSDEDGIEHLIGRWNDDTGEHQRALAIIAAHVPEFGEWYGEALTHVRKLQSESAVYLPVIQRVKADIDTELQRDNPEDLEVMLAQTADKYPGLGGLDDVREDLARYVEIRQEARGQKSGRLFALLRTARFVTPPFKQSFRGLIETGQLPSAELLQQYDAATKDWEKGNSSETFAELQPLTTGPWGSEASAELERRRGVAARFAALDTSRAAENFVDQLLAFVESLDTDEDVYFARAAAADLKLQKASVIARAQDSMNRARLLWQEYRINGAINAAQRSENSISAEFRTRARLLAQAREQARRGFTFYSQIDVEASPQWSAIRNEIDSEVSRQRSGLNELGNVLAPELLRAKLVLIGDGSQ